jgi:hypothetical protein
MVERKRSKDGTREAQDIADRAEGVGHQGREGGRLARQIGTEDELKRALENPAGATRVTKSDEKDDQKGEGQE